jgi:acyl transferase domain-containing protein/acyl carrier protein
MSDQIHDPENELVNELVNEPESDVVMDGIAIIGMAGRFPGARNIEELWQNLCQGVESISIFSDEELLAAGIDPALVHDPKYVKAKAILEDVDQFDAAFFGYNPKEAEVTDPQHRLFMECAWEALEDAGYDPENYPGLISVFAGANLGTYLLKNILANPEVIAVMGNYPIVLSNVGDYMPTRLSYKLNLKGPSLNIQTACSTSLVAVCQAYQSLMSYQSDLALAGGVSLSFPHKSGYLYQEGGILSPDGHCRAFDAAAQGTVSGEGVGIVALKRLEDALADGDHIYAIIRGAALNNDGALKVGYAAPSVQGQADVVAMAQTIAGVEPEAITYIEAHGTGTQLGDPIEIAALTKVFRAGTGKKGFCALGSVKSNFGHLESAAGVTGLIKTALMLTHRQIPPSLHFRQPNPKIDFANSPFYVNTQLAEWPAGDQPRYAGVSSFGIGGTNAHVVLEEAPPASAPSAARSWHLLTLSARSRAALEQATANLATHLRRHPEIDLANVAYTLQVGRRAFAHRRVVVCSDVADAIHLLEGQPSDRVLTAAPVTGAPKIAFLFPGQGAQHVGMARDLYQSEPLFRRHVDEGAELLRPLLGVDLRTVLYPTTAEEEAARLLDQTYLTQPALFVIEYALAKVWIAFGVNPQAMVGHSIGEYVAATLAGVFSLKDALRIVAARGRLMQEQPPGSMLAVSLTEEELVAYLSPDLAIAAINAPSQSVVSGPAEAVSKLQQRLVAAGVPCRLLRTSHAFHSKMMEPAVQPFADLVSQVRRTHPEIPFIANVTGQWITPEQAVDPIYWADHLRKPVRFADSIGQLQAGGYLLLEVGPSQTLTALARMHPALTNEASVFSSLSHPRQRRLDDLAFLTALGKVWLAGGRIEWSYKDETRRRVSLPTYPFERQSFWVSPADEARRTVRSQPRRERTSPDDWFYLPSWSQTPSFPCDLAALTGQDRAWLIFQDECGLGMQVAERLRLADQPVTVVLAGESLLRVGPHLWQINPSNRNDYLALFAELERSNRMPTDILHLWSVTRENDAPSFGAVERMQELSFYSLLYVAQALGERSLPRPLQMMVVANNLHDVSGEEELHPEKATLLGPCRVIPQEYANVHCRSIDIVWPSERGKNATNVVDQILGESLATSSSTIVAYRGRHRWVQSYEPVQLETLPMQKVALRQGGTYLITGGLGGIGLALAEYLAQSVQAKLVLVGRTALPDRPLWDEWLASHDAQERSSWRIRQVQALERLGAEVMVVQADVTNLEEMAAVVEQAQRRFGQLHGVIHAAGIPGAGLIQLKTRQMTNAVLDPKVKGTMVLDSVLAGIELDFLLLCSTLTSLLNVLGQVDYTAANAFLDAYAHRCQAQLGRACIAVNWDRWQETGMAVDALAAEALRREGYDLGRDGLTTEEGQRIFSLVAGLNVPQVIVSTQNLNGLVTQTSVNGSANKASEMEPSPLLAGSTEQDGVVARMRPELANPFVAPQDELEEQITEVWRTLLGIQRIGVDDSFFELGGDSLLALRLAGRLRETLNLDVPLQDLFDAPTIAGLAGIVRTTLLASRLLQTTPGSVEDEREEVEI